MEVEHYLQFNKQGMKHSAYYSTFIFSVVLCLLFSPAVTGLDAENPGTEKCDNKQSLHIYSLELLDLCQVSATCREGGVSTQ